ncbi:hypothetical protein Rumeso_03188 [Rubellimicrobium mesophilum DSM 19309]|uniref:DUF4336 domain-containing protein n=1 Tax=Rubellimicrobium mesophilum DSM 19309 TaxID=442562 RepID=A0A017HL85_9RHOB|nr:DUF4336 domain-containing protein [Rubellimicrobium mesophilum]EYD75277.1 hypothetical protein Rumeso_03188 [Rubellimicrobium mesophilum DSM 19309]
MATEADRTYPPLDTLKEVGDGLWIVDSVLSLAGVPLPVRMTVARLADGGVWLHSPTRLTPSLREEVERLGPVAHLVAPNSAHWVFVKDWQAAFPEATTWAAPGLRDRGQVKRSGLRIDHDLASWPPEDWAADLDQLLVTGGMGLREVAFLHLRSRTLILTDLVQNFEADKLSPSIRPFVRLGGGLAPDGMAPPHYRTAMNLRRKEVREAARRILDWAPERVVFAHGAWFDHDGTRRLRRSLRWLL